ncbi:MAG: hydantoinase/oxoprolinase family protein [Acidimicrobiales bacterium]
MDTGGTFTDVVVVDEATGALTTTKTPSTPADPSIAFLAGVDKALAAAGATWADVASVFHGTTVATNALLQGEISGLGFLTTAGFRHLLEIGRQSVPDGYGNSYSWIKPDRIVPLHLVREVPERLDATGTVVHPLDEAAVTAEAAWFRDHGVTSVGVCLLHAYANPAHERRVRELFAEVHPECSVSISSDVLREYREYERSVTTLVDAFVKPAVARYVARLSDELRHRARADTPFYVMKSNGGVASAPQVAAKAITTILSGPAAGALGAAAVTAAAGFDAVVTLDGGGTSTDVAVIRGGTPSLTTDATVGRFPAKVPMIDIVTVGAGGGSIAWVSPEGTLKVGPRSAGADPGPCCYGHGGTEVTLTDAALVLGRIPAHLLGGEIPLDVGAATAAVEALAASVGMAVEPCAAGIMEIGVWNQANAIRQVTVRRGIDVRDLALCAFGGSGPLAACRLLDVLDLPAAVIPRHPGNLCAFGLLTVDVRIDDVRTFVAPHTELDLAALVRVYGELEGDATAALTAEGFGQGDVRLLRGADVRYDGQAFEVRVDVPAGPIDASLAAAVLTRFHDEHERLYGYCYRDQPRHGVEWVNVRLTGVGPLAPARPAPLATGDGSARPAGTRPVWFDDGWVETDVWWRPDLGAGDVLAGPAVIEEYGSTVPVPPGVTVHVDAIGTLVARRSRT